ncbi:MAG: hypothetical protein R3C61_07810 [Bacteroidia bacterium]
MPKVEPCNCRRLFLQSFFEQVRGLNYGLLNIFRSEKELQNVYTLELVVFREELSEWEEICNLSPYIAQVKAADQPDGRKLSLKFTDYGTLEIRLYTALSIGGLVFEEAGKYIDDAMIDRDGIKRVSRTHNFEYHFLNSSLSGKALPHDTGLYLLSATPEEQREILQYLHSKYGISVPGFIRLINNVFLYRESILDVIRNYPENKRKNSTSYKIPSVRGLTKTSSQNAFLW